MIREQLAERWRADGRVSATIVNGTNGQQLVLSSAKTGNANVIKLSGISGIHSKLLIGPAHAGGVIKQALLFIG